MPALPSDIAKFTNDGVLVRSPDGDATAIKALYADARDEEESPEETFFTSEADAIAVEAVRFAFLKRLDPEQDEIETDEPLGVFAVAPVAPKVTVKSEPSDPGYAGIVRAFVYNTETGRYALSVLEG